MFSIFLKKITKDYLKILKEVDNLNQKFIKNYFFLFITLFFIIITCVFHSTTEFPEQSEHYYILKEYEGKLALFESEEITPKEIFDININIFPENDIKKLQKGILAENEEELIRLIEDFSG